MRDLWHVVGFLARDAALTSLRLIAIGCLRATMALEHRDPWATKGAPGRVEPTRPGG